MFYIGPIDNPVEILRYGDIPEYITEEFWSMFYIWNNTRLTKSLPFGPAWADNPKYLVDIITAFQQEYENIRGV